MLSKRVQSAVDFFDGKTIPSPGVPPGFRSAGVWALKLNATDVKYVRQQLRFMVQDGLAQMIWGRSRGQKTEFFKLLPVKRCKCCKGIIGAQPRKLFLEEYK